MKKWVTGALSKLSPFRDGNPPSVSQEIRSFKERPPSSGWLSRLFYFLHMLYARPLQVLHRFTDRPKLSQSDSPLKQPIDFRKVFARLNFGEVRIFATLFKQFKTHERIEERGKQPLKAESEDGIRPRGLFMMFRNYYYFAGKKGSHEDIDPNPQKSTANISLKNYFSHLTGFTEQEIDKISDNFIKQTKGIKFGFEGIEPPPKRGYFQKIIDELKERTIWKWQKALLRFFWRITFFIAFIFFAFGLGKTIPYEIRMYYTQKRLENEANAKIQLARTAAQK